MVLKNKTLVWSGELRRVADRAMELVEVVR